ncbi:hypothetical protein [Enterococcus faecalis]|uniref:hypothetical protein n=1 Tax=Enterococcus faecalis TaxID=1351 RepID=UPI0001E97192|nr:hypothetical protein [Enterococcus faecalis]EFQ72203.1 nucleic acid-binding domain protein [Enterococcus faecalis TX0470]EOK03056.1 hypothetical protein WOM_00894 [Enterococcus faecalis EnGen0360]
MKPNYVGTIHKIKVLTTYPEMLVRFSLQTQKETINCIISKKELADELLVLPDGTELAVYGHLNKRKQLVIDKMLIRRCLIIP